MPADPAPDRCPRCGQGFRCGIGGAAPCACTTMITLDADLQAQLRTRYDGCLCLACLQALAAGAPIDGGLSGPHTSEVGFIPDDQGG